MLPVCGVKFCGGCNPRYERLPALEKIKAILQGKSEFCYAEETASYDVLLVIGGCERCCASYEQYTAGDVIKMWDESQVEDVAALIEERISVYGLEENL